MNLNQECTIDYIVDPSSQAINGVDFEEIPLSITIPAGDTAYILPINVIDDTILEGPENFKILLQYPCNCLDAGLSELIIDEPPNLSALSDSILVCADQSFYVTPEITMGIPPFEFKWDDGAITDSLELIITQPVTHVVSITDFCGDTVSVTINVGIQSDPTASISGSYSTCNVITAGIPIDFEGNPPWSFTYNINGIEQESISGIVINPYILNANQEGTYTLTAFSDAHCSGIPTGSAEVVSPFEIEVDVLPPSCFNSSDGSIAITTFNAEAPFTINWDIINDNGFLLENLSEGTYTLNIVDGNGCTLDRVFELYADSLNVEDCVPVFIPNVFSPNSDGINDVFSLFIGADSGVKEITSFGIYSRWGELLYQQSNIQPENLEGWNGYHKGQPLNANVFAYLIVLTLEDGTILNYSGSATLVR